MPRRSWQMAFFRPPVVAVHDNAHMLGHSLGTISGNDVLLSLGCCFGGHDRGREFRFPLIRLLSPPVLYPRHQRADLLVLEHALRPGARHPQPPYFLSPDHEYPQSHHV